MAFLLALSETINSALERIARAAGWLFLVLIAVIVWDILTRKFGFQIPGFGSTKLQELEWHLHGVLFLFWLGYAYVRNVHVRIDVFTAHRPPRTLAWLEIFGILVFAIPYCIVATWFAYGFAEVSFLQGESSDAPNGLPHRWFIKSMLFLGLVMVCAAVLSILARNMVFLFGPRELAARAAPPGAAH